MMYAFIAASSWFCGYWAASFLLADYSSPKFRRNMLIFNLCLGFALTAGYRYIGTFSKDGYSHFWPWVVFAASFVLAMIWKWTKPKKPARRPAQS